MTSSDSHKMDMPKQAQIEDEAFKYIELLTLTRLAQPDDVELRIFLMLIQMPEFQSVDQLPTLILQAPKRRRSYRLLMKLAAKHIEAGVEPPSELKRWLIGHLTGEHELPKGGRRGPNKADMENYWLKVSVEALADKFGIAVYPTETGEQDLRILSCFAKASRAFHQKHGSSPYPTTTLAMKNRYLKARDWWKVGVNKVEYEKK